MSLADHEQRWAKRRKSRKVAMLVALLNFLTAAFNTFVVQHHWWTWYLVVLNIVSGLLCVASNVHSVRIERRSLRSELES